MKKSDSSERKKNEIREKQETMSILEEEQIRDDLTWKEIQELNEARKVGDTFSSEQDMDMLCRSTLAMDHEECDDIYLKHF
ncbi:hypothetical protein KY290_000902 [Solanum tuberosum]|uniref:Uncharacterized protein n=1 Tax=Solanum tuberosum TaxID=4113 RepID=A0ABQ7WMM5_SOLTU|nr:hypothetical protein KY290_000902 [Solanum tuberosum]